MGRRAPRSLDTDGETDLASALDRLLAVNARLQREYERFATSEAGWREERALLLAMLDTVPDYIFAKDRQSRFLMANRAVAADLGKTSGEALFGLTDFEMQPDPEVARKFVEDDRAVMEAGRPKLDIEEYMHDSTGAKQWLSTSKVPLRNRQGEIIGIVGVARNVNERKRIQDQMEFLAHHDALTGLPNRFLFEQRLDQAWAAAHDGGLAALLYLDLDRFKTVNDTLGHPAGDELIRQVAARLRNLVQAEDTVARLGGDEFAVVIPNAEGRDEPEGLSRRILDEMNRPFELFDDTVFLSASIGIAHAADASLDSKQMWQQADLALYRAKARGRGCYEVFAAGMAAAALETRRIEQDLREALALGTGLHAVFQPVFDGQGCRVVGAEALVRWQHPERGMLSPQSFVAVAEERGLIDALGELMLREACTAARRADLPWIAVNVSPLQFRREHFDLLVLRILRESGLPPGRLQLEITEGVLLDNSDRMRAAMARLRAAGVTMALDDFGTGYSSMNYLRRYNVDKLKIDRSFVAQLGASDDARAIVRAIVTLAGAMHLRVTAEGVETAEQRDVLIELGCDELQGFFLGRPMSAEALIRLRKDG